MNLTTCPRCKKRFLPAPEHVFKENGRFYCTWTCFNHRHDNRKSKYKPVLQYTLNGEFIREFESVRKAADYYGVTPNYIGNACRGKIKTALKSIWKYKSDVDASL